MDFSNCLGTKNHFKIVAMPEENNGETWIRVHVHEEAPPTSAHAAYNHYGGIGLWGIYTERSRALLWHLRE